MIPKTVCYWNVNFSSVNCRILLMRYLGNLGKHWSSIKMSPSWLCRQTYLTKGNKQSLEVSRCVALNRLLQGLLKLWGRNTMHHFFLLNIHKRPVNNSILNQINIFIQFYYTIYLGDLLHWHYYKANLALCVLQDTAPFTCFIHSVDFLYLCIGPRC